MKRRTWTREERRRNLRKKYYPWKAKIFVMVACLVAIFIFLYLLISGVAASLVIGGLSAIVLILLIFTTFFFSYGMRKKLTKILIIFVIAFILLLGFLTAGSLSGTEQVVAYIILGFLFLLLLAFAVFFVDTYTYEAY